MNYHIVCGKKLVNVHRDIYRNVTNFEFENGLVVPITGLRFPINAEECYRALTIEMEKLIDPIHRTNFEAFSSPETLIDEDPDELDPYPVFVCQCCRDDYEP